MTDRELVREKIINILNDLEIDHDGEHGTFAYTTEQYADKLLALFLSSKVPKEEKEIPVAELLNTMDASIWAKEFMRLYEKHSDWVDLDLMRGWFANSIMTGHDIASRAKDKEIARLRKALMCIANYEEYKTPRGSLSWQCIKIAKDALKGTI